jgi:hypothetical protein
MLFAYSTNICIHSLVSGQQDWAHVRRVVKSCARSVSPAVREEGVLVQDEAFLCVIATIT